MSPEPRRVSSTHTHPDLPGWELRLGGNLLRGRWRFRQQETAAAFAWEVLMQCFQLDFFPNVTLWNRTVTLEAHDLKENANLVMAEILANVLSKVTGPPQPRPIEAPLPYLVGLEKKLRRFEYSRMLLNLVQAEVPEEGGETGPAAAAGLTPPISFPEQEMT